MVNDYDCEIIYHSVKENVVSDALSRKSARSSFGEVCMRISVDSTLLGLIREEQAEGFRKENWKQERISGDIDMLVTDS